ncbi:MAG: polysaccharide deacetylase family protein [Gammaproteobacteria bacterium]|nr:polysaccharide deacetylase family protein [Gammaproteobacteria bacterium]
MLKVPVFYYHSIGNVGPETLSVELFRQHLELLKSHGFTTLTCSELLSLPTTDSGKYALLTFDDGLLDNYDKALPLLLEYGFKATFFVIPGFDNITRWVNASNRQWSDEKRPGFTIPFPSMQANHRKEMTKLGMEIGCHTMNHPKLNKINVGQLNTEIIDSKTLLEDQLGNEVSSFCYPKGRYNPVVLEYVKKAGYRSAFTTMPGYYSTSTFSYECGRFLVESPGLFSRVLAGSLTTNRWIEWACHLMQPGLKLKNVYM